MLGQVASGTQLSLHQNCLLQDRPWGHTACLPRLLQDGKGCQCPWPGGGDPWFCEANPTTGESSMLKSTGTQYPSVPSTYGCPGTQQVRNKPGAGSMRAKCRPVTLVLL